MAAIFTKVRLRPSQLRTVADRRLGDARCLCDSGQNQRANGAMYMAGFVLECLLKALLLEKHTWLQSTGSAQGLDAGRRLIWSLCYRSHDLDELLNQLPEVYNRRAGRNPGERQRLAQNLKSVCAWTIFARYSPESAKMKEADDFLRRIEEIKEWLKR